jgi:LemA protein
MRKRLLVPSANFLVGLPGCSYNTFQVGDEQIKASCFEVVDPWQRRADSVLNLLSMPRDEAQLEQSTLTQGVAARAGATSIQAVQVRLSGALPRSLFVSANDPDLQAPLEGTANWITESRNRPPKSTSGAP